MDMAAGAQRRGWQNLIGMGGLDLPGVVDF